MSDAARYIVNANQVISCDPPYYDNIGYSDLSDFFYVWLRRSLGKVSPDLFGTLLTPKAQELIASPYRHNGNREDAQAFFEQGLGTAFVRMREVQNPDFPLTVYYAFKQSEDADSESVTPDAEENNTHQNRSNHRGGIASTGWETMLSGLIRAGFSVHGTWPMRTELGNRPVATGTNALASSIVLVCRPRLADAPLITRREFVSALKRELPKAVSDLQRGNIALVDLAQASIGPGMAVFTRYSKVMESDGSAMSVRTALALINQTLDEFLTEQEGELDADTRWALAWFEQFGMEEGPFGMAETLSKAKNTGVNSLVEAGIVSARSGRVKLIGRDEMPEDWDPVADQHLTVWEATQHLIHALDQHGEQGAADLARRLGGLGETARDLSYRLYSICERKKWAKEALAFNSLVIAWPEISKLAQASTAAKSPEQTGMYHR
jgi:putative DNA methylase